MTGPSQDKQGREMRIKTDQARRRLLAAWQQLGEEDKRTVSLFAEFLAQKTSDSTEKEKTAIPQFPLLIPKPEKESAVLALKRLKKSYPMIETDLSLLDDASQCLMKKVMGSTDEAVILKLEELFANRYQAWREHNIQ